LSLFAAEEEADIERERGHLMRYLSHVGLALLIVAGSFASLQALPSHGIMETFYTDNTFTDEVGYWYASCSGAPYLSGSRSPYVYYEDWSCDTGDYFDCYYGENCTFNGNGSLYQCYPINDVCGGPY
jgi:hypothetical protein